MPHSKQRYLFIDLLRFLGVFFMIQGHTFDALLEMELRKTTLFFVHDFFHGFIAPMFLFASGVAFGISTMKKWEEHTSFTRHTARRFGKFVGLLFIGYALHVPYFSLTKVLHEATQTEWNAWLQVDALHCIAVTMLILQTAVLLLKTERRFILFTGVLGITVIVISPLLWSGHLVGRLPLWIVSYLNMENNSWFPLFPWSAYIFCGVVFAWVFLNAKEHHQATKLMERSVVVGLTVMAGMFILMNLPIGIYPPHDIWKANPLIVLARLGFVAVVTSGVFFAEHSLSIPSRIPQTMGRESLFIYIVHLIIIYGSAMNRGLQQYVHATLSVWQASAVFVFVLTVITLFTYGWSTVKRRLPRSALAVKIGITLILLFQFMTRPY